MRSRSRLGARCVRRVGPFSRCSVFDPVCVHMSVTNGVCVLNWHLRACVAACVCVRGCVCVQGCARLSRVGGGAVFTDRRATPLLRPMILSLASAVSIGALRSPMAPLRPAHVRADPRCVRLNANDDGNPLLRSLSGLGQSAMAKLEKEMQVAAMQDPELFKPQEFLEAVPLPDSFDDAIRRASTGCSEATADGSTSLVVEFDTSAGDETYNLLSRSLTFVRPFLPLFAEAVTPTSADVEKALSDAAELTGVQPAPRIQLLFPDEGTAAYVKQNWDDLPSRTICSSMPRAQLAEGVQALVLVAPAATEVPAVQRLIQQVDELAPATVVLLVNPKLVDMQSTGYGLVGRELRNMVEESFTVSFALKSYPDGALHRLYPDGWAVWREDENVEGGYELAYSAMRRPSGDDIEEYLAPPPTEGDGGSSGGNPFDGLGKFIKGFQAL